MSNCNCQTVYTASIDEDFTGKCVKDTYQKVIHVGGSGEFSNTLYDGTGSFVDITLQMYQKH